MELKLYWFYAFNVVVNSALSFFTTILLIEGCVCLFRITNPRIKVICRILPFFKICLDLCLYHVSKWALLHGVNPILAEPGSRQLSLVLINPFTGIQLSLQDGKTFSVADVIALFIGPIWVQVIVCMAGLGSLIACLLCLMRMIAERRQIARIVAGAIQIPLIALLQKNQVTVATSEAISSPCIIGRTVLFPTQLLQNLSGEEVEAIIVHEMAHLRWKDCVVRLVCSWITALFWWIPTRWWQKRIEEAQELAADAAIHKAGISGVVLAGAILKTAQSIKRHKFLPAFSLVGDKSPLTKRVGMILKGPRSLPIGFSVVQYGLLLSVLVSILFGTLWIF